MNQYSTLLIIFPWQAEVALIELGRDKVLRLDWMPMVFQL